jgi:hypothetical protein
MPQPMTRVIVPAIPGTARKGRPSGEGTQGGLHPGPLDPRHWRGTKHPDEF